MSTPRATFTNTWFVVNPHSIVMTRYLIKDKILGKGCFSTVYEGLYEHDLFYPKVPVAIKINVDDHEIELLQAAQGTYVLKLINFVFSDEHEISAKGVLITEKLKETLAVRIATEEEKLKTLEASLKSHTDQTSLLIARNQYYIQFSTWLLKIAIGLREIRDSSIVHKDINEKNILLDERDVPKICDFGLAQRTYEENTISGTPPYLAPENYFSVKIDHRADIYSFGILILKLTRGSSFAVDPQIQSTIKMTYDFFDGKVEKTKALELLEEYKKIIKNIHNTEVMQQSNRYPSELTTLALKCIEMDPLKRPTLESITQSLHLLVLRLKEKDLPAKPVHLVTFFKKTREKAMQEQKSLKTEKQDTPHFSCRA